jgi:hypothetical protein
VVNGLAMTCKFPVWHSWEGLETATGAYGVWCKPAHTVLVVNNFNFNYMRVRFLKSKEDTCSELECILLEIRHLHARHYSSSGTFAPAI